jgi:hypothetical protein
MIRRAVPADKDARLTLIGILPNRPAPFRPRAGAAEPSPLLPDNQVGQVRLIGAAARCAVVTWTWSPESGGGTASSTSCMSVTGARAWGRAMPQIMATARASAMFLETQARNKRAGLSYQRCGFTAEDSVWMACALP